MALVFHNDICAQGSHPFLVLAPHGGRRPQDARPRFPVRGERRIRINDLHSADVAEEIAARLNGSCLINREIDRNDLDLNRISQVTQSATWFLTAIDDLAAEILESHEEVTILVVHGWNINQSRCDIGVGADLERSSGRSAMPALTVSTDYAERVMRNLARDQSSFRVTLGTHYPAAHYNNLLQLFRRDASRASVLPPRLATAVRHGRCQALQLELGIPLRWPGRKRTHFIEQLSQAFDRSITTAPSPARPHHPKGLSRASLQLFDAATGLALLANVDRFPGLDRYFGRLVVFLPNGAVALYTGEARDPAELASDGPSFTTVSDGRRLRFDGSLLVTPNGDTYVDLEYALAHSNLQDCRVELNQQGHGECAPIHGSLTIGKQSFDVTTRGFTNSREWGAWRRATRANWSVRIAWEDGSDTVVRSSTAAKDACSTVNLAEDRYTPLQFRSETPNGAFTITPISRMSIVRPIGKRRRARVSFGPARVDFDNGRRHGHGIFEYARLIDRP